MSFPPRFSSHTCLTALALAAATFVAPLSIRAENDIGLTVKASLLQKVTHELLNNLSNGKPIYQKTFPNQQFQMENLQATGLAQLALTLGTGALGLETPKNLKLDLALLKPSLSVQPKISGIEFQNVNSDQLDLSFKISLTNLTIAAEKIAIKERNIILNRNQSISNTENPCNPNLSKNRFYRNGIYTDLISVKLFPSQKRSNELTFQVRARLKTSGSENKNQIKVLEIQSNAESVLTENYKLTLGKAVFPDIQLEINGKCYPLDHGELNKIIQNDLETLKNQLISASASMLIKKGIETANESLKTVRFKPEYSMSISESNRKTGKASPSSFDQMLNQLENLQYSIGLHQLIDISATQFGAVFSDRLSEKERQMLLSAPELSIARDVSPFVRPDTSDLILTISKNGLESKLNLIKTLKVLEKSVLTKGISIDDQGFRLHRVDNDKIAITAFLKIELDEIEGFSAWFGSKWESLFGSTDGIIRVPLQINLTYSFGPMDSNGGRMLRFHMWLHNDFLKTQFGEKSNLDQSTGLIRKNVIKQINEFQSQISNQKMEIHSSEIESKIGFSPYWIKVNENSDILFGLGFKSIKQFLPKTKNP